MTPDRLQVPALVLLDKTHEYKATLDEKQRCSPQTGGTSLYILLSGWYLPILLLWSGIIPFAYRFHALSVVMAGSLFFAAHRRYRWRELGFRTDNLRNSIYWNLLFCALGAVCLYLSYRAGLVRPKDSSYLPYVYVMYILLLAPVQELLFRGMLFAEMRRTGNRDYRVIVLVSTSSFCFLHTIYNHPPLLIISFASGLIWSLLFIKWPNIWGVSLSHALLGALAMFLGMI